MKIKIPWSKERVSKGLKYFGKLRPRTSHSSILTFSALSLILFIAFTIRIFPMRWEIQVGSMHLSEFDPYFQYRFADHIVKNGFISWVWPEQWIDNQRWYPNGINVARAGFPGLPMTAAFFYKIISALGIGIELMDFCALFPAIMGMLASLVIYFLGRDIGGKTVGLLAALFLALNPSFIQRTSLGFFDDETIGIFALLLFAFLFLRAIEQDRQLNSTVKYSLASGVALGYFCAGWGAAFYPIGLTVLFVFVLILLKRYTQRLLLAYSITFGLGLFIAINVPRLSSAYITTIAILPVAGVFISLCFCEIFRNLKTAKWRFIFTTLFLALFIGSFATLWQFGYMGGIAGKFISVINPFTREASPLIESVAEHRVSAWGSIYYDLGIGIIFFAAGLFFILVNLSNKNLFLLIFGLTSLYFACSMVRLLLLLAPAFSILAAVGIIGILKPFTTLLKEPPKISVKKKYILEHVGKEFSGAAVFLIFIVLMTNLAFPMPKVYSQAYSPVTITAGSLPIPGEYLQQPVQEWINMLQFTRDNLDSTTVVCSWWDYGYWLTIMGDVTTLVDNATINSTQIENVGFIFMSNETQSLTMLKRYNAQYILVFVTLRVVSQSGVTWGGFGDEGKWMWMARISGKARDRFLEEGLIDEKSGWTNESLFGNYSNTAAQQYGYGWVWNARGQNSTLYKLMSWGAYSWMAEYGLSYYWPEDTWPIKKPEHFELAYLAGPTSEVGYSGYVPLVCLYKIKYQST